MIKTIIKYGVIFIVLVLFQELILNNVEFGGYINPYLYVLFIIFLPFDTPDWLVLILGFMLGIAIDSFTNTLGMHTSATVFMAFCRAYILKLIAPRDGYVFNAKPNIQQMGITWYLTYIISLVLLHHIFLFYVETFNFSNFFTTLGRALSSSFFTIILILIIQLFNYKSAKKA